MFKIPQGGRFSQPNNSDLFGNIWTTKNMNFDEEGYIKLSNRSVLLASESDATEVGIPISSGRQNNGTFLVVTSDSPLIADIRETAVTYEVDTDSGNPALGYDSWGRWWQNRWYVTGDTSLYYKSGSTWTNASVSITSGLCHAIEVFRNRLTLVIANGSTLVQIDTSHSTSGIPQLSIPADYEITGIAYSNNKVGIATKLSDSASSQNQEAYFFVWDGASNSANGGFPVGSDTILAVRAYKSSWVILTRAGQILFWNGGGFDVLVNLPFYYFDVIWGDPVNKQVFGDAFQVEGDLIYLNINYEFNLFGNKSQEYLQTSQSGVLCYDPRVGLYHRYSPSISRGSLIRVASSGIDTSSNVFTANNSATLPETGNPIKYTNDYANPIGGLMVGSVYYIIRHSSTTFSLAETKQDAIDGNKIDITSTGASSNYFFAISVVDFGASRVGRTAGMALVGYKDQVSDHLIFGGELYDNTSSSDYDSIVFTVGGFKNIGYFITPKLISDSSSDTSQNVEIKFRPLVGEDKIVIKHKDREIPGIPVSTPQGNTSCTWTSSTVLTTTADLSEVEAYLNDTDTAEERECEVEIISGAGAGQLIQIDTIVEAAGTYTITLAEEAEGVSADDVCDILIDNWKEYAVITADSDENDEGALDVAIGTASKWHKFKVVLSGVDTKVEEFAGATINHKTL